MESQTFSSPTGAAQVQDGEVWALADARSRAPLGVTLALTASIAVGLLLFAVGLVFAAVHPEPYMRAFIRIGIPEQNQQAKTALYVLAVVVILPVCAILVPRLLDRIAAGESAPVLVPLAALIPAGLAVAVLFTRLSGGLPWGDGLWVLTAAVAVWLGLTALALAAAAGRGGSAQAEIARALRALHGPWLAPASAVLVMAGVLSVTKGSSLHPLPLVLGAVVVGAVVLASRRHAPRWVQSLEPVLSGRGTRLAIELAFALLLTLAILPRIIVDPQIGIPNIFFGAGIVQYHQDFLLGPANQLVRGGGALMVTVPISQYGVGTIYFLDAVFHILPIGYGTYGLIDGALTAVFYLAGYWALRAAGVRRLLAAAAIGVGVVALLYDLRYPVGQLPQQGPLRFGLPMAIVLGLTAANRWPARARAWRAVAFAALGLSAIWALEAFVYSAVTFAAMLTVEALAQPAAGRRRWILRQVAIAVAACVTTHLILAGWTLAATGHLPNWGEYATYIRVFLIGGGASKDVYGFETWSPGLAVSAATLAAAIVLPLVLTRARGRLALHLPSLVALAGLTALMVAFLSYSDNRSSTYLLAYVTLPLLMIVTLWLGLVLRDGAVSRVVRTGALAATSTLAAVLIAVAWPSVGSHFSRTLLSRAYPGGGLRGAVHALVHQGPIDPRAPAGVALLDRYIPGNKVIVFSPQWPDLTTEILIRDRRADWFFTGDPKADSYVPTIWTAKLTSEIASLRPGTRVLFGPSTQAVLAVLAAQPNRDVLNYPIGVGDPEQEWVLQHLRRRFTFQPLHADGSGFVVEQLVAR